MRKREEKEEYTKKGKWKAREEV